MKRYIIHLPLFLLIFMCGSVYAGWRMPSTDRRYNETCFLEAHNSYASRAEGYTYAQQMLSFERQFIDAGVRVFNLDTFYYRGRVRLCHESGAITASVLRPVFFYGWPTPLADALIRIKNLLNQYPSEIVTLVLENYVERSLLDEEIARSGIQDMVMTPAEWNPESEGGWPTLAWMQQYNKRVVIFNDKEQSTYSYHQWSRAAENMYGVTDIERALEERSASATYKNRKYLFSVNLFSANIWDGFVDYFVRHHNTVVIRELIARIVAGGLRGNSAVVGRYPNFINLNHVQVGGIDVVNEINQCADDPIRRAEMFHPIG